MIDKWLKQFNCGSEAKEQAKARCFYVIETSIRAFLQDKAMPKHSTTVNINTCSKNCSISVSCKDSRVSLCFEDTKGDLATGFQWLHTSSTVSESSFQSCIPGDDEEDAETSTRKGNHCITRPKSRYPLHRIRFNGVPWKGYDSLQTFGIEDLFSDQPFAKQTPYAYSSSAYGSDLVDLDVYESCPDGGDVEFN